MSKTVFKFGQRVRFNNTNNPAIVCLYTEKSVLIQTKTREFWVKPEEIREIEDKEDSSFDEIKIPPSMLVLDIQSDVDQTVYEYTEKYSITSKDRERVRDSLMGAVMRKQLLQARDGKFNGWKQD